MAGNAVVCTGDNAGLFWENNSFPGQAMPVYATMEVYLDATTLATWLANAGGDMALSNIRTSPGPHNLEAGLHDGGGAFDGWNDLAGASVSGHVTTGWHTVQFMADVSGHTDTLTVDGSSGTATFGTTGSTVSWVDFGAVNGGVGATELVLGQLQIGTTPGGNDLLDYLPCRDGDPVAFGFTVDGSGATLTTFSPAPPSAALCGAPAPSPSLIGIRAAFGFDAYDTGATFIRVDEPTVPPLTIGTAANNVTAWQIDRGRSYELDKTQTGTAQLTLFDTSGVFDPTNPASPLYGKILPMLQAKIGVQNPITGAYTDLFTGFIESWDWTITTEEKLVTILVGLVDGFEPLTRCEIPVDSSGTVTFLGTSDVQTRLDALLDVATWPADPGDKSWRDINTGNVFLQAVIYNAQQSVLAAMQDAADGEFPGVANIFMKKNGAVAFRGRYPRFQPTNYPQDVNFWTAVDRGGLSVVPQAALIKDIEWTLDQKNVINACLCYPYAIPLTEISAQLFTDPTSISQYGERTLSLPDLLENGQPMGGGISPQPALDANQVAYTYAQYYVKNYAQPKIRISKLVIEVTPASDVNTWNFLLGVEIGDIVTVITTTPGGGFGKGTGSPESPTPAQFFVEGIHYTASIQSDVYVITLSLDVSPRGWFTIEPWAS